MNGRYHCYSASQEVHNLILRVFTLFFFSTFLICFLLYHCLNFFLLPGTYLQRHWHQPLTQRDPKSPGIVEQDKRNAQRNFWFGIDTNKKRSETFDLEQIIDCFSREVCNRLGRICFLFLFVVLTKQISNEMEKYPQAKFMPKPRGHDDPLKVEKTSWSFKSSYDWIEQNGLKSQKLNIYHVLAPNAYSYIEKYVPVLNKTVQSQIHEVDQNRQILVTLVLIWFI